MPDRYVLFVCVENSARSLIAEAIFNWNPPAGWRAVSAGTSPAVAPNPRTERVLREIGLVMPPHPPQLLTEEMMRGTSTTITMGCLDSESCPARLRTIEVRDWSIPDPAPLDDEGFRKVRDEIRARVEGLRRELILADRRRLQLAERTGSVPGKEVRSPSRSIDSGVPATRPSGATGRDVPSRR